MSRRDATLLLLLSAIWGSSFLFIKLGVDQLEPSVVVLGRLVVGVLVLLPLVATRGGLRPLRGHAGSLIALGALNNAVPFWLLGFAETRLDSGLTAVIQAAAPIFTVLLAGRIDPTQHVRGVRLAGIAVGLRRSRAPRRRPARRRGDRGARSGRRGALLRRLGALRRARDERAGAAAGLGRPARLRLDPDGAVRPRAAPERRPPAKTIAAVVALGALGSGSPTSSTSRSSRAPARRRRSSSRISCRRSRCSTAPCSSTRACRGPRSRVSR